MSLFSKFKIEKDENGVFLTKYKGKDKVVVIPDKVTFISARAFEGNTNIETIIIPSSVSEIGMWAFKDCVNLKNIQGSENIQVFHDHAFQGCENLTSVSVYGIKRGYFVGAFDWPYKIEKINENTYSVNHCSLEDLNLEEDDKKETTKEELDALDDLLYDKSDDEKITNDVKTACEKLNAINLAPKAPRKIKK